MKRPALTIVLLAFSLSAPALTAVAPLNEIKAATAVVLGRSEVSGFKVEPKASFEEAVTSLRAQLADNPIEQGSVAYGAYYFVYGTEVSVAAGANPGELFAEQVSTHLASLAENPAAYQDVVQRAYRYVVGRDVYEEEIAYWDNYAPLPYALLVGCIEDWARRNQPGLMSTAGTPTVSVNCELLETLRLDPELADRVATFIGLPPATAVLAPGGAELSSSGGIRFLVTAVR